MRKFILSYIKYYNLKYGHQGPLFNGPFRAVRIESTEQLLHTSRYIHLNPLVSLLTKDLKLYPWSSYHNYIGLENNVNISKEEILSSFKFPEDYEKFVLDQVDYGTTLELLKHQAIDAEL